MKTTDLITWQTANKQTIEGLSQMLDAYTLDPTMMNYGKYAKANHPKVYHPKHRPEGLTYDLLTRFEEACWDNKIVINKSNYIEIKKLINAHYKTQKFQDALLARYNCVRLELTYYTTEVSIGFSGNWWRTSKSDLLFPIEDWFTADFKTEYKRLQSLGDAKGLEYDIKIAFAEQHFTSDEYEEAMELIGKADKKTSFNTYLYQSIRFIQSNAPGRSSKWKEYTYKCSGRSIIYDPLGQYSFNYIQLGQFIKSTIKL